MNAKYVKMVFILLKVQKNVFNVIMVTQLLMENVKNVKIPLIIVSHVQQIVMHVENVKKDIY